MENLDEMDNFLHKYQVPKLSKDQINNLTCPRSPNEIETVINSLLNKQTNKQKNPGQDVFSSDFYQTFKEELIPILCKLIPENNNRRNIANSFYKATIILIPKSHKEPTKTENFRAISLMNIEA